MKQNPSITVYSKAACQQCRATMRHLDKAGVTYAVKHIDQDHKAAEEARATGHLAAPIVVANIRGVQTDWSGFNPDLLNEAIASATDPRYRGSDAS